MTDHELLCAISGIVKAEVEPMKEQLKEIGPMKEELKGLKEEILPMKEQLKEIGPMKEQLKEIGPMKEQLERMDHRLARVEIDLLENSIIPQLDMIESCYFDTFERYKNGADDIDQIKIDVDVLQRVVKEHSEKLNMIS